MNTVQIAIFNQDVINRRTIFSNPYASCDITSHDCTTTTSIVIVKATAYGSYTICVVALNIMSNTDNGKLLCNLHTICNGESATREIYNTSISSPFNSRL